MSTKVITLAKKLSFLQIGKYILYTYVQVYRCTVKDVSTHVLTLFILINQYCQFYSVERTKVVKYEDTLIYVYVPTYMYILALNYD